MVNFYGIEDEGVFTMYLNGVKAGRPRHTTASNHYAEGSGEVVVGRLHPSKDEMYSSIMVDELIFYNRKLCAEELQDLFDMYA